MLKGVKDSPYVLSLSKNTCPFSEHKFFDREGIVLY